LWFAVLKAQHLVEFSDLECYTSATRCRFIEAFWPHRAAARSSIEPCDFDEASLLAKGRAGDAKARVTGIVEAHFAFASTLTSNAVTQGRKSKHQARSNAR
jgi:hypothetical protein